jgi:hypothetical protein
MAIDASVTQITVAGNYVDFLGNPIAGQIQFTLSDMLRNSLANQMVTPSTVFVTLDGNGSFSTSLPATNDPDMIPTFEYTVEEAFPKGRTYAISLPVATAGSLNLADISPAPTLDVTYVGLATEVPFAALETDIAALDALVNQSTNEFPLAGSYSYIPQSYASYTETNAAFATYTLLNAGPYPVSGADLAAEVAQADAARISAQASAATASASLSARLNPLLLIGG